MKNKEKQPDIIIVGTGVAGLFCALHLPADKNILMITKDEVKASDSFLAQGGICVLKNDADYANFFRDTMKAGHYENRAESVDIMIRSSREVIDELVDYGVRFEQNENGFVYTREGGHSTKRILFHKDVTGEEITEKLLEQVKKLKNVMILECCTMLDILRRENECYGIVMREKDGSIRQVYADYTILASGGIGGLFTHSTNYRHLTGDALAIALKHKIELEHLDYIQIHPTTFYSTKPGRRFLISESVRGEGAILLNKEKRRFVNELLPRDVLTNAIHKQMEKENTKHVWLDMRPIGEKIIHQHFPNIYQYCFDEGYDVTKECIPVVPAQHYFMGGIKVDSDSKSSMERLFAIGETSCNGVHGANRLASNSLLEAIVFSKRAAQKIAQLYAQNHKQKRYLPQRADNLDLSCYTDAEHLQEEYKIMVKNEIERLKEKHGE